jgi:2-C-methyl-D-erythritol 4-phosphate cytidylyltransferase/2-C-methyl-D-erythritol 2,4-cyclodiphosphate synthase
MYVVVIVAAGGQGRRFGGTMPKQLVELGGRTVLERSVSAFVEHARIADLVVALPSDLAADPPPFLAHAPKPLRVVSGGNSRQESVANGFAAVSSQADVIVVHDAARPLVDAATIDRTIDAAVRWGAAIAAVPAHDTVKVTVDDVASDAEPPRIGSTLDRTRVWLAQTPQAFRREVLADAVALGLRGALGTDEAALAEQAGHRVRLVQGSPQNLKITTPDDLVQAEVWLRASAEALHDARSTRDVRIGIGYDSHRLVQGRQFVLGGVRITHSSGPIGHSDGDALCHAITDAILGAAALGDIGRHFPDTDPAWKDADSIELLRRALALVRERGLSVAQVDAVVIAERPKLAPHVEAIRARLAAALDVPSDRIGVKGKTNEGMGETGRGEAIVVHAIALLYA